MSETKEIIPHPYSFKVLDIDILQSFSCIYLNVNTLPFCLLLGDSLRDSFVIKSVVSTPVMNVSISKYMSKKERIELYNHISLVLSVGRLKLQISKSSIMFDKSLHALIKFTDDTQHSLAFLSDHTIFRPKLTELLDLEFSTPLQSAIGFNSKDIDISKMPQSLEIWFSNKDESEIQIVDQEDMGFSSNTILATSSRDSSTEGIRGTVLSLFKSKKKGSNT
jgi:hypothetical protein